MMPAKEFSQLNLSGPKVSFFWFCMFKTVILVKLFNVAFCVFLLCLCNFHDIDRGGGGVFSKLHVGWFLNVRGSN